MFFCPICKYKLDIVRTIEGKNGSGFFECKTCNFSKPLENGTVFLESNKNKKIFVDPKVVDMDIYARKIIKKCSNTRCPKRDNIEAAVWKDDDLNVFYICMSCNEIVT